MAVPTKPKKKYMYVEDFVDPKTGQPYEGAEGPIQCSTLCFGVYEGHQIAKIEWKLVKNRIEKLEDAEVDEEGNAVDPEGSDINFTWEAHMGEKGGFIQSYANLAQEGDCWVYAGAHACQYSFVSGDASIKSGAEIGGVARVTDNAVVTGIGVGVGGHGYVYGDALVEGVHRMAVDGHARVGGRVSETSRVYGGAEVFNGGVVEGLAEVYGFAQVQEGGHILDEATAKGCAIVYGEVKDSAVVAGSSYIESGARINDTSIVTDGAMVGYDVEVEKESVVAGQSSVSYPCRLSGAVVGGNSKAYGRVKESVVYGNVRVGISPNAANDADSTLQGRCTVVGNCDVQGKVRESSLAGNVSIDQGEIEESTILDNATVGGILSSEVNIIQDSHIEGNASCGYVDSSNIYGGGMYEYVESSIIGDETALDGSIVFYAESADIRGNSLLVGCTSEAQVRDGCVVASSAYLVGGLLKDNARIVDSYEGIGKGNGVVTTSSGANVQGNSVLANFSHGTSTQQVVLADIDEDWYVLTDLYYNQVNEYLERQRAEAEDRLSEWLAEKQREKAEKIAKEREFNERMRQKVDKIKSRIKAIQNRKG